MKMYCTCLSQIGASDLLHYVGTFEWVFVCLCVFFCIAKNSVRLLAAYVITVCPHKLHTKSVNVDNEKHILIQTQMRVMLSHTTALET